MAMGNDKAAKPEPDAELDAPSEHDPNLTVREFNALREELKRMWNPLHDQETRGIANQDGPAGNPPANASRAHADDVANDGFGTPQEKDSPLSAPDPGVSQDEQRHIDLTKIPAEPESGALPAESLEDVPEAKQPVAEQGDPTPGADEPKDE